ncbi:unnamed protein product [Diamesa hyperborea]
MPTNAVYQPTTVQFENSGMHFQTSAGSRLKSFFRKTYMQVLLLILGLLFLTTGIVLTASAAADYEDVEEFKENISSPVVEEETDIGLIVLGVFFTIFGFVLLALYIKVADWRRNCVCPCGSKKQFARQLQGQSGGGQILALNPSTDPLVSHTQYAPVSEIPRVEDEEERRNLMTDNNLSTADESERMLSSSDPRIVLRPLGGQNDDAA